MEFITNNIDETIELAYKLGLKLQEKDVVLFTGDLGAGKTHMAKGIGKALGVTKIINSPTFTIVKEYQGEKTKLYHLDLYRLDGLNNDYDLEEYIEGDGVCLIEWPYQVEEILPKEYIKVNIEIIGDTQRRITIEATPKYKAVLGDLK